jgi:hypothetical protein
MVKEQGTKILKFRELFLVSYKDILITFFAFK